MKKYQDKYTACKITLPVNQSTQDFQFKSEPFEKGCDKGDWIECWGEKDGNVFVSKIVDGILQLQFTGTIQLGLEFKLFVCSLTFYSIVHVIE